MILTVKCSHYQVALINNVILKVGSEIFLHILKINPSGILQVYHLKPQTTSPKVKVLMIVLVTFILLCIDGAPKLTAQENRTILSAYLKSCPDEYEIAFRYNSKVILHNVLFHD